MTDTHDLWLPNPFAPGALPEPEWLVGRDAERRDLKRALRDRAPVLIIRGPRGIGKTSFVTLALADGGQRVCRVNVGLSVPAAVTRQPTVALGHLYTAVADELRYVVPGLAAIHGLEGEHALFSEILPAVCTPDTPRLVLVMDELDLLDLETWRSLMRRLARTAALPSPPLWVLIGGWSWSGSPIPIDVTRTIDIGPLTTANINSLLDRCEERGLLRFIRRARHTAPDIVAPLADETQGYPVFVMGILDALYEGRWEARNRAAIGLSDLRDAATRFESRPSPRVIHALDQAGPAARLILHLLSNPDRGTMTDEQVRARVAAEHPQWGTEVDRTLANLTRAGLAARHADTWRITVPLLQGVMQRMSADDLSLGRVSPEPVAWDAWRRGESDEATGQTDEALTAYRQAIDADQRFWPPKWRAARLLVGRHDPKLLTEAIDLLKGIRREVPSTTNIWEEAGHLLSRALVTRLTTSERPPHPDDSIELLRESDPELRVPGAAQVVAEYEAGRWIKRLERADGASAIRKSTRQVFRTSSVPRDLLWDSLAERLAHFLELCSTRDELTLRGAAILSSAVPVLAAERHPGAAETALWSATITLLRRLALAAESIPPISAQAWRVMLSAVPEPHAASIRVISPVLVSRAMLSALSRGDSAECEALVATLLDVASAQPSDSGDPGTIFFECVTKSFEDAIYAALSGAISPADLVKAAGPSLADLLQRRDVAPGGGAKGTAVVAALVMDIHDATPRGLSVELTASEAAAWRRVRELLAIHLGADTRIAAALGPSGSLASLLSSAHVIESQDETDDERRRVEERLEGRYRLAHRVHLRVPGLEAAALEGVVRAWTGHAQPARDAAAEQVLIREFRITGGSETARLLRTMWGQERRALTSVAYHPRGRALLHALDARDASEDGGGLLVTEWFGGQRLRDAINTIDSAKSLPLKDAFGIGAAPLSARVGRAAFWSHAIALLTAVDALHEFGLLHRAISPDVVYLTHTGPDAWKTISAHTDPLMRLGHFEWSVYLRSLSSVSQAPLRPLDRYTAPEVLRSLLRVNREPAGETFASDLYALGLLLFESTVRPLTRTELKAYRIAADYDDDAEQKHRQWLKELRDESNALVASLRLHPDEATILESLLAFHVSDRDGVLDDVLECARRLARGETDGLVQSRMVLVTPVVPARTDGEVQTPQKDLRENPRSMAYFLARCLDEVAAASQVSEASIADLLARELRNADVYLSRAFVRRQQDESGQKGDAAPLLVRSHRSGVLYRVSRFWLRADLMRGVLAKDRDDDGSVSLIPELAFLEVARDVDGDIPLGESVAQLPDDIDVFGISRNAINSLRDRIVSGHIGSWEPLFQWAAQVRPREQPSEQMRERVESFARFLRLSVDVEHELAWREVAYARAEPNTTKLRAEGTGNLAAAVAGMTVEDLLVEVGSAGSNEFVEVAIEPTDLDEESGIVTLRIDAGQIPDRGVLRAASNRGTGALHRRRRAIVQEVSSDEWLLRLLTDPAGSTRPPDRDPKLLGFFQDLDDEKQDLVKYWTEVRPSLVVQGPPGTGKTTLATEVLLQEINRNRGSRIVIASPGHDALDNILERLAADRRRDPRVSRLLGEVEVIRIPSGRSRLQRDDVAEFMPHRRAEALFARIRKTIVQQRNAPGLDGAVAQALDDELGGYDVAPDSLRRRVIAAANLVFVTCNAREIEEWDPCSFDVAVIEEAARTVPIELAAVMRLARRHLLIGDHEQLAPFSATAVAGEVTSRLDQYVKEAQLGVLQTRGSDLAGLRRLAGQAGRWMHLFRHLITSGEMHDVMHKRVLPPQARVLVTQWRMHPDLADIVSDVFYEKRAVKNPVSPAAQQSLRERRTHPLIRPDSLRDVVLLWVDFDAAVTGTEDGRACSEERTRSGQIENNAERRAIVGFLRSVEARRQTQDIAILTPYRAQAEQLRGLLDPNENWFSAFGTLRDNVHTVDAFQGRQAGIVLLSLVRNNSFTRSAVRAGVGFLSEKQRATVMFSRAERLLVVFGSGAHFERFAETHWICAIRDRAKVIDWKTLLDGSERAKLAERVRLTP